MARRYGDALKTEPSLPTRSGPRASWFWVVYAWIAYLLFARSTLYLILFLADVVVEKTVDRGGPASSFALALATDLGLLLLFCAHHSLFARSVAKRWLEHWLPPVLERSTYVLVSSLLLILLMWQWRPLPEVVWVTSSAKAALALRAASFVGWGVALLASIRLGHLETFGVRRVWAAVRGMTREPRGLKTDSLYSWVRHPMYLGFLIGLWAVPRMTVGHLIFAAVLSLYLAFGRLLEERELIRRFGDGYRRYRDRVPALLPRPPGRAR